MTDTDPEFDPDDFEAQLKALFDDAEQGEPEPEPEPDPEVAPEDPDEGDGEGAEEGADGGDARVEPPSAPSQIDILGREFNETDARSLVEFYDWVKANPAQAIAIDTYLRGQATFVPVGQEPPQSRPAQPAEPEEDPFEDADPALRAKLAEIDELRAKVQNLDSVNQRQRAEDVKTALDRGAANAKAKYGLADEEVQELMAAGAQLNVLPGIAEQRNGDLVGAVEETLDLAYWSTEKFRDMAVQRFADQRATETKRQKKASSLSGGSGSVPRTPKEPSTNEGRREAMVNAIAEAMTEQTQE